MESPTRIHALRRRGREDYIKKEEASNNCFNLTIPVVMKIAVVAVLLGNFHAKPFGPELQVKQMLAGRLRRKKATYKNLTKSVFVTYFILANTYICVKPK